jgi:hypothetical protein
VSVFSAGVVLFVLLSGRPPFSHPSEPRLLRAIMAGKYGFDDLAWDEVGSPAWASCDDCIQLLKLCMHISHLRRC